MAMNQKTSVVGGDLSLDATFFFLLLSYRLLAYNTRSGIGDNIF